MEVAAASWVFTLKAISKTALELSEFARIRYILKFGSQYEAEQLVFVDESAYDLRTYLRKRVWALQGRQACRKEIIALGKKYSILPAISLNGMLDCTILEGSFNAASLTAFVSGLLDHMQPWPAPNSVIVMDNCTIHKSPELRELIESRGMKLEFLPAYSPDFNPIELALSLLKSELRRVGLNDEGGEASVIAQLYGETMSIAAMDCRMYLAWKKFSWRLGAQGGMGDFGSLGHTSNQTFQCNSQLKYSL